MDTAQRYAAFTSEDGWEGRDGTGPEEDLHHIPHLVEMDTGVGPGSRYYLYSAFQQKTSRSGGDLDDVTKP